MGKPNLELVTQIIKHWESTEQFDVVVTLCCPSSPLPSPLSAIPCKIQTADGEKAMCLIDVLETYRVVKAGVQYGGHRSFSVSGPAISSDGQAMAVLDEMSSLWTVRPESVA